MNLGMCLSAVYTCLFIGMLRRTATVNKDRNKSTRSSHKVFQLPQARLAAPCEGCCRVPGPCLQLSRCTIIACIACVFTY